MEIFYGILIPFLGTSLGAACVFFMKKALSDKVQRSLTGFAAGVMVAASVWSLLIPAIQQADSLGKWAFVPAVAGFWIGVLFLLGLDHLIPHLHQNSSQRRGPEEPAAAHHHDGAGRNPAQHSRRHGRGRGIRGLSLRQRTDFRRRSAGAVPGHRHPEFPRGGHHLPAPAGGGRRQGTGLRRGRALGRGGTDRAPSAPCWPRSSSCPPCRTCSALPPGPCFTWWWRNSSPKCLREPIPTSARYSSPWASA